MTPFVIRSPHEHLVDALTAELHPLGEWAEERARNMACSLLCQPGPHDDETPWTETVQVLRYRHDYYPLLRLSELDELAVRCLRAFVLATWETPPSRLEVFTALRRMGTPERWLQRLLALEVSAEGVA